MLAIFIDHDGDEVKSERTTLTISQVKRIKSKFSTESYRTLNDVLILYADNYYNLKYLTRCVKGVKNSTY